MIHVRFIIIATIILSIGIFFLFLLVPVQAAEPVRSLLPQSNEGAAAGFSPGCIDQGSCQIRDFIVLAVRLSQIILGVVGSLALGFFVYGGVWMILSAGNAEEVKKAKAILVNAVIGIVIIFASWSVINFVYTVFIVKQNWSTPQTFVTPRRG